MGGSRAVTAGERNLKILTAKKESLFGILQTLLDLSKNLEDDTSRNKFHTLHGSVDKTREELHRVIDEIAVASFEVDEDYKPNFAVLQTIDEMCCHIQAAATKLKSDNANSIPNSNTSNTIPNLQGGVTRSLPSLPKIELPEFSGDIREWETFHSVFNSLIHENVNLTDMDKVHYLVGRLKGAALTVCSGLAPTGDNYDIIWKSLLDKYQDERALANSYFNQIMEFRPIHNESSKGLNSFLERFDSAVKALKKLNIKDLADYIIAFHALSKLDSDTVKAFETSRKHSEIPTYDEVSKFVRERSKILNLNRPSGNSKSESKSNYNNDSNKWRTPKSFVVNHKSIETPGKSNSCQYCHTGWHYLGRCEKFKRLIPSKRYEVVRDNNWCFNCLSPKHGVRSCPSERSCTECAKRHHILLHTGRSNVMTRIDQTVSGKEMNNTSAVTTESAGTEQVILNSTIRHNRKNDNMILLSTAVVNVINSPVKANTARFLLDTGSQTHLITENCCKRLGIKISKIYSSVQGLGKKSQVVRGTARLIIGSRHYTTEQYELQSLVVETISEKLPRVKVEPNSNFSDFRGVEWADDKYFEPGEIDGIIGAELFLSILGNNQILGKDGTPLAVQTTLGFVVMGKMSTENLDADPYVGLTLTNELALEQLLNKFWEIEEVPKRALSCPEESECEAIFTNTVKRDKYGRFTVALPFKGSPKNLGESKRAALSRLMSLEKKLAKMSDLRNAYNDIMKDFIEQKHMKLRSDENSDGPSYYIPHHAVFKLESLSTPVRVVLDASALTDSGVSLNDLLYGGPKLQTNIFTLLINFRLFQIALTSDIRQMYRQINVIEEHHRFQRVLWRFNPDDEVRTYEMGVVAFGVRSSPYLALRTIKQLIRENGFEFPLAAKTISRDLYMDDLVTSIHSEVDAWQLYQESIAFFLKGQFDLTKWSTNSKSLLDKIPTEKRLSKTVVFKSDTKILGMQWNPETDILSFNSPIPENRCTKRIILSSVARCYDPIGLIAPFVLYLKLLVKELWQLNIGWDEEPPSNISDIWYKLRNEWSCITDFKIPRFVEAVPENPVMLLAFADASKDGYGAVIYLRTRTKVGEMASSMVCAKSKVAPSKIVSIPRLELCAAVLLTNLLKYVSEVYSVRVTISKMIAFSDSTTVIQWLNSAHVKDVFVSHRIAHIRETLPNLQWRHIEGITNPADCLSRGLTPSQLVGHVLWASGPTWIQTVEEKWPVTIVESIGEPSCDHSAFVAISDDTSIKEDHPLYELIKRRSSWIFILHTTVRVLQFSKIVPKSDIISSNDLRKAELILIKIVQNKYFSKDIKCIEMNDQCSSRLRKLRPFVQDGLLRVGGRLSRALLNDDQQHPFILPSKDPLIDILIDFYHNKNLHPGPHLLEAILRQRYWILAGRNSIRRRVHACNRCFRLKPKELNSVMADLPSPRVQQAKVFLHTGVDYFGPINITLGRKRGSQVHKAYVCLFVCMCVKAVHLELVSSLSTDHFLQAFKRFLSRRGPCKFLYSDRGSNFVGAKRILTDVNSLVNSEDFQRTLITEMALNGIEWKFNVANAPHHGGLWESNVKSAKTHIYRVIGDQLLTYEEFSTLLAQVEALLNSRPLCRLSADPSAPEALTPAHFLTLTPLSSLPAEDVTHIQLNRLDRFQLIDNMVQGFWKRWHLEYLSTLQIREKWNVNCPSIEVGTVVVLKIDHAPPLHWPLAVITAVHPGKDGVIRTVTLKTGKSSFMRPIVKVCPLPTQ